MSFDFGDELTPLRLTLAPQQVADYVHAANQAAPRFLDDEQAKKEGLPGQIAPGNMSLALFSRFLESAAPGARVLRISATFRSFVQPKVPLLVTGVVTDVTDADDEQRIECDLLLESEAGERLVTGTGSVVVPR